MLLPRAARFSFGKSKKNNFWKKNVGMNKMDEATRVIRIPIESFSYSKQSDIIKVKSVMDSFLLKASLHIQFPHAFSVLRCISLSLTLIEQNQGKL